MKWILPILLFSICPCIQAVKNEVVFKANEKAECVSGPYKGKTAIIKGSVKEVYGVNAILEEPALVILPVTLAYLRDGEQVAGYNVADEVTKFYKNKPHNLAVYFKDPLYYGHIGNAGYLLKASWLAKKNDSSSCYLSGFKKGFLKKSKK